MKKVNSRFSKNAISFFATITTVLVFLSSPALAGPVKKAQSQKAVRGWLKQNKKPMGQSISQRTVSIEAMIDDTEVLCYILNLEPAGFVITAADDDIEPIIAFSPTDYYHGEPDSPLTTLLKKDMTGRLETIRRKAHDKVKSQKKSDRWQSLIESDRELQNESFDSIQTAVAASVSEVWVDPFVQSHWNQDDVSGSPCYNYYTPNNYPTGCVATAMAQVMRYHSWPTTGIGVKSFSIKIDGVSQSASTRGGNGSGGAYDWSQMPYDPQSGVTTAQRQAIGALLYDAGVTANMSYYSSGSSASLVDADQELTTTFKYSNSIYTQSFTSSGDDRLWNILNANLDAQLPVILGISRTGGGHAVVADGYGYIGDTLYHHINMGWGGSDNAWYQLPTIDATYTYTVIDDAVYNIYTSGTGEIISGRVTNLAGGSLSNVTVSAKIGASVVRQDTTDSWGVYALTNLSPNTMYTISASKGGENFLDQTVTTGNSNDWSTPGNRSGILFVSANVGPPTAYDMHVDVHVTDSALIQLQGIDDGVPDPNLFRCIITSLPSHGVLSEPTVGFIETIPYELSSSIYDVNYLPCPYFGGQDSFTYKANDGGTYPTGGDSNIATVTVNVNDQLTSEFGTESNTYLFGMMMDTDYYYDARSQVIYLPSEIGAAKRITDLSIRINPIPGRTLNNWTIRMQHTNKTYFNTSAHELLTSGWTTVYQGNVTITQTGWINFHFDAPFDYNGDQNLMVDFSFNNTGVTSPYGGYFVQDVSNNRVYSLGSNTGAHGDPLTWADWYGKYYSVHNSLPSIKLIGVSPVDPMTGDFDASCDVKLPDLAIFSQAWQTTSTDANYDLECDMTMTKGSINIQDLILFAEQWFEMYPY
jgi:hypothetical protein